MSLFRHILVLFFIFATHQSVKSEGSTHRSTPMELDPVPELDVATLSISHDIGAFKLEISLKNDKCVKFTKKTKDLRDPEDSHALLGSEANAGESCDDLDTAGNYYIKNNKKSDQAFKVNCNVDKKSTCLIVKSEIEASSLTSSAITLHHKPSSNIWLSQTGFDVHSLYNNIGGSTGTNRAQISYLLSTSISVNQTIKYYYNTAFSNGTIIRTKDTKDNKVASLKALLWNDHSVGSYITKQLPMKFTSSDPYLCWSGSDWVCSTINFQDNSNKRLPVTDFYIEDVQTKLDVPADTTQMIYFELVDLCFIYD